MFLLRKNGNENSRKGVSMKQIVHLDGERVHRLTAARKLVVIYFRSRLRAEQVLQPSVFRHRRRVHRRRAGVRRRGIAANSTTSTSLVVDDDDDDCGRLRTSHLSHKTSDVMRRPSVKRRRNVAGRLRAAAVLDLRSSRRQMREWDGARRQRRRRQR